MAVLSKTDVSRGFSPGDPCQDAYHGVMSARFSPHHYCRDLRPQVSGQPSYLVRIESTWLVAHSIFTTVTVGG